MLENAQFSLHYAASMVYQISTHNVFSWDRRPTSGAKVPERFILNNCLQESKVSTVTTKVTLYMENDRNK